MRRMTVSERKTRLAELTAQIAALEAKDQVRQLFPDESAELKRLHKEATRFRLSLPEYR